MLSVSSYKYENEVNERTQEISELMKLHMKAMWQTTHKSIRQLAHKTHYVCIRARLTIRHVRRGPSFSHTRTQDFLSGGVLFFFLIPES